MYIYKTTCLINGKIYIGQCQRSPERSKGYFGSGSIFTLSKNKYGKHNFVKEILKRDIENQKQLDIWEQIYIKKFNACDPNIGYNLLPGTANKFGCGAPIQQPCMREEIIRKSREACAKPESKKKLSDALKKHWNGNIEQRNLFSQIAKQNKGSKNPNFGNKWTEEQKQNQRDKSKEWLGFGEQNPNFGNKWSEKQRSSLSRKTKERFKNTPNPMTNRKRITNGLENRAIPSDDPLPEGWRYGLTMKSRQKK